MVKVAVVYYSSTGTNYKMANWAKDAAEAEGAEVKLVKVPELAPMEAIESNPAWKAHYEATKDVPDAKIDDLDWADAIIWSVPTRFGNVPGQVKQFIDQAGGLWAQGKLVNKVVSAMSSAQNAHGVKKLLYLRYTKQCSTGERLLPHQGTPIQSRSSLVETHTEQVQLWMEKETFKKNKLDEAIANQAKRTVAVAKAVTSGM